MISLPASERKTSVRTSGGLENRGSCLVSGITLDGGIAATGATVVLDDSTDGSGTAKWALRAAQYKSESIVFSKPIPFATGLYVTLTPSGQSAKVSLAYT